MACNSEIHLEDIGTQFIFIISSCNDSGEEVPVNISTASVKTVRFQKPSGEFFDRNCLLLTDGVDGKMYYSTVAEDLDELGTWKAQATVTLITGTF